MKFRAKFQPCTDTVECLLSVNFLTLKATLVLCLHSKSYVVGLIEHQYTRALTPTASILGGTNLNVWCDQKKTDHTKHPTLNGRETEASARFRWQLNEIIWKILIEKKKIMSVWAVRSSQIPSRGSLASRETKDYISVLTATYFITWNTLNLTDALLSSQACIFYQEMHSQKCLTHNFTKITWINALLFPRAGDELIF